MHSQHRIHPVHINRNATERRIGVPFERRSRPERHHRYPVRCANLDDFGHFFRRLRINNNVRCLGCNPCQRICVLHPDGLVRDHTCAKTRHKRVCHPLKGNHVRTDSG